MERGTCTEHVRRSGRITISPEAIAQIVAADRGRCYGVVGMGRRRARAGRLLRREQGRIRDRRRGRGGVSLELHVVVEYGLNLAEVAATVRSQVAYEVERLTGLASPRSTSTSRTSGQSA